MPSPSRVILERRRHLITGAGAGAPETPGGTRRQLLTNRRTMRWPVLERRRRPQAGPQDPTVLITVTYTTEKDVRDGGIIYMDLTNGVWTVDDFDAQRQGIINAFVGSLTLSTSWNDVVTPVPVPADVERTSDTRVTLTISGINAYDLPSGISETVTSQIPKEAVVRSITTTRTQEYLNDLSPAALWGLNRSPQDFLDRMELTAPTLWLRLDEPEDSGTLINRGTAGSVGDFTVTNPNDANMNFGQPQVFAGLSTPALDLAHGQNTDYARLHGGVPLSVIPDNSDFTLSFVIDPDDALPDNQGFVVGFSGGTGNVDDELVFALWTSTSAAVEVSNSVAFFTTASDTMNDPHIYHLTLNATTGLNELYVDGVFADSGTVANGAPKNNPVDSSIVLGNDGGTATGGSYSTTKAYGGQIQHLAYWPRRLEVSEIEDLAQAALGTQEDITANDNQGNLSEQVWGGLGIAAIEDLGIGSYAPSTWTLNGVDNPRAEFSSSKNLLDNPAFRDDTTGWVANGTNTIERVSLSTEGITTTGLPPGIEFALKCTYQDDIIVGENDANVLTAAAYAWSTYVYIPAAASATLLTFDDNGTYVSATGETYDTTNTRDQWVRLESFLTPDAGDLTGDFTLRWTGGTPTAGDVLYIAAAQIEQSATVTTFFDELPYGSTPTGWSIFDPGLLTPGYQQETHADEVDAPIPEGVRNRVRLIWDNLSGTAQTGNNGDVQTADGLGLPAVQSDEVAFSWYVRLLSDVPAGASVNIMFNEFSAGLAYLTTTGFTDVTSQLIQNEWVRVTAQGTVANASTTTVRGVLSGNDIPASSILEVEVSSPQLEKGLGATPYTDGGLGVGHSWASTVDLSHSTRLASVVDVGSDTTVDDLFDGGGSVFALLKWTGPGSDETATTIQEIIHFNTNSYLGLRNDDGRLMIRWDFDGASDGEWVADVSSAGDLAIDTDYAIAWVYDNDAVGNNPTIYVAPISTQTTSTLTVGSGLTETVGAPVGTRVSDAGANKLLGGASTSTTSTAGFNGFIDCLTFYDAVMSEAQFQAAVDAAADATTENKATADLFGNSFTITFLPEIAPSTVFLHSPSGQRIGQVTTARAIQRAYRTMETAQCQFTIDIDEPLLADLDPQEGGIIVIDSPIYPDPWVGRIIDMDGGPDDISITARSYDSIFEERLLESDILLTGTAGEIFTRIITDINSRNDTGVVVGNVDGAPTTTITGSDTNAYSTLNSLAEAVGYEWYISYTVDSARLVAEANFVQRRGESRFEQCLLVEGPGGNIVVTGWRINIDNVIQTLRVVAGQAQGEKFSGRGRGQASLGSRSQGDNIDPIDDVTIHGFLTDRTLANIRPTMRSERVLFEEALRGSEAAAVAASERLSFPSGRERSLRISVLDDAGAWQCMVPGNIVRADLAPPILRKGFNGPLRCIAAQPDEENGILDVVVEALREM